MYDMYPDYAAESLSRFNQEKSMAVDSAPDIAEGLSLRKVELGGSETSEPATFYSEPLTPMSQLVAMKAARLMLGLRKGKY